MESYIGNLPAGVLGLKPATNVIAEIEADGTQAYYDILLPDSVDPDDFCLEILVNADGVSSPVGGLGILHGSDLTRANYTTNYMLFSGVTTPVGGQDADTYLCRFSDGSLQMVAATVMFQDGAFRWEAHGGEYDSSSTKYDQFWYFGRGNGASLTPSNFIRIITLGTFIDAGVHIKVFDKKATNLILPLEYSAPRKNYIVNPCFSVNQRGYAGGAVSTATYLYTCWKSNFGGGGTKSYPLDSDGFVTIPTGASMHQGVEWAPDLVGKQMTLSWEGTAEVWIEAADGYTYVTHKSPHTFTVPDIGAGVGDALDYFGWASGTLKNPKLELGTTASPFDPPDTADEMAKCHRYLKILEFVSYQPIGGLFRCSGAGAYMTGEMFHHTPPMRAAPSVSFSATPVMTWKRLQDNATAGTGALSVQGNSADRFYLYGAQAGVNADAYWGVSSSSFNITFSAEL